MGVVYEGAVRISRCLKEELAWAMDKRLQIISHIMLLKNSYTTEELKCKAIFKFKVYFAMW